MERKQMPIILYMSFDGGFSYRQQHMTEEMFKKKMWDTACKWLRPDSDMSLAGYGIQIIVRYANLALAGIIPVAGGDSLEGVWKDITDLWEKVKKEA